MDLIPQAALTSQTGPTDPAPPVKVDNNLRSAWNDYVNNFLAKKGLKGHPSLDHNGLGFKMIDEYRKENPNTPLTKDMVVPIQQDFSNYRNWAIKQIESGKGAYAPGANKDNFLKSLSTVDGIPGQMTTSYSFPKSYLDTFADGKHTVTDQGYATAQ
jgi:hypothetical protein